MYSNYFKTALRHLLNRKGIASINLFGLTLGLTGCVLIALFVHDEWQFDRFIPDGERVYRIYNKRTDAESTTTHLAFTPAAFASALQRDFPEVEKTLRVTNTFEKKLFEVGDTRIMEDEGFFAEESFFELFPLEFEAGNPASALKEPNTVVISTALALKYFGSAQGALGQSIAVAKSPFRVTGVLKKIPRHFHLKTDYFLSYSTLRIPAVRMESWVWQQTFNYVKLRPNTDVAGLQGKFQKLIEEKAHPVTKVKGFTYLPFFQPLQDIHLHSADFEWDVAVRGNATYVNALAIIAVFVLLIACFNFVNLSTAQSLRRAKEVGIRKAIGAQRSQLQAQFTSETLLLSLAALILAVALTQLLTPALNNFADKKIDFNPLGSPLLMLLMLGLGVVVGLVAGAYPSFVLARFHPEKALKGTVTTGLKLDSAAWVRKGLVVLQFALSVLLICSALIVYRQVDYLHNKDMGFNKEQVMLFAMQGDRMNREQESFKNELLQLPDVVSASVGFGFPGDIVSGDDIIVPGKGGDKTHAARQFMIDYDYVKTMGLRVIAGRSFSKGFPTDAALGFMVNETALKELGLGAPDEAVGKPLHWNMWGAQDSLKKGTIIGVVQDFHFESLQEKVNTAVLQIYPGAYWKVAVRLKPGNIDRAVARVQSVWNKFSPDFPLEYSFVDNAFDKMYTSEDKLSSLLWIFTGMAIVVGCLGLFGLAMFSAEQRTKEIGIRKVLGASVAGITGLLAKDFLKLVLIAILFATPAAWYFMQGWLANFPYRIELQPWMFMVAGGVAVTVAFLTVSFQSIRAALANPVKSLRVE